MVLMGLLGFYQKFRELKRDTEGKVYKEVQ